MKIRIPKSKITDPERFIRRAGYGRVFDRRMNQVSYAKRLHGDLYPRFHVYVNEQGEDWVLNLHLDQRATRYEGVTAHSGEYDGAVVEKEAERIMESLKSF
ncbi:hypothetical protein KKA13_04705 [Patescibacteria group bacterium]|nr:hypothetical protein [Patescibacteria group bacterium]MBU1613469.1 hypothetical protein [Patescibacteria group bacterium]